jgi:AcrR family transcriptional regulator
MKKQELRQERESQRREEIRRHVVLAAEAVILRKGFTAATMDDVAREAELSKATLYKYFPGKGTLLFELFNHYFDEIKGRMTKIAAMRKSASARLELAIREIVRFHLEKENLSRIMMMDQAMLKFLRLLFSDDVRRARPREQKDIALLKAKNMEVVEVGASILRDGIEAGEFRRVDPLETVAFIASLLEGIVHNKIWRQEILPGGAAELSRRVFVFILSGIGNIKANPKET